MAGDSLPDQTVEVLTAVDRVRIERLRDAGAHLWVDLTAPAESELADLGELLKLHPLAVEDSLEFNQAPKVDRYPGSALIVFYGARADDDGARPLEVHLHIGPDFLVTVRLESCRALEEVRGQVTAVAREPQDALVYRVLDALTDTLPGALDQQREQVGRLRSEILRAPQRHQLQEADRLRSSVDLLQRRLGRQHDRFGEVTEAVLALPGAHARAGDYLRDVADHLTEATGELAGQASAVDALMNLYFSTSAERVNVVSERLTLLATVLVPLTLVTGFFGMNFGWLVDHIETERDFWLFGIGGTVLSLVATLALLARWRRSQ